MSDKKRKARTRVKPTDPALSDYKCGADLEHLTLEEGAKLAGIPLPPSFESLRAQVRHVPLSAAEMEALRMQAIGAIVPPKIALRSPTSSIDIAPHGEWLVVHGKRYDFHRAQQRCIVMALFEAWQKGGDGAGLRIESLQDALGVKDTSDSFSMYKIFGRHEALRDRIIRRIGRGLWALDLREQPRQKDQSTG